MSAAVAQTRGFKGIWIPADLYLDRRLSVLARMLVAEIDSLSHSGRPCWASDSYLADFLGVQERHVQRLIAEAEAAGWVHREVVMDARVNGGRVRYLRKITPSFSGETEGGGGDGNDGGGGDKNDRTLLSKMSAPHGESKKADVKEKQSTSTTAVPECHGATPPRARACARESKYPDPGPALDMQEQSRTAVYGSLAVHAAGGTSAHAHEAPITPPAAGVAAWTEEPLPFEEETHQTAGATSAAVLLSAFDIHPGDADNDVGWKGGECSSRAAGATLCPLEEALEDLMEIEDEEGLDDDLFDGPEAPRMPVPDPTPEPAPPTENEGEKLLLQQGIKPHVATSLAGTHDLARIRDVCELALLRGWSPAALVACFSEGYDREKPNRRRLAAARGIPEEALPPPPSRIPVVKHPSAVSFAPIDDAYRRHLRGEETPEEREAAQAAAAFIREQMAALFPECAGQVAEKPPERPPEVPLLSGASDPRPIAEILAERETAAGPRL